MLARSHIYTAGLASAVVALCIAIGFYSLFSNFRAYDDEGLLLVINQLYLDGAAFYTDIPWIYGPGYLATVHLFHDWLGVPLSHSASRFTTLACWLLLCTVSAVLVYKLTARALWAIVAFALTFVFTGSFVNEPGHPQGLIAIATIFIPLTACYFADRRQPLLWFLTGVMVAAIFHIKINAGVFVLAALCLVLAARLRVGAWQGLLHAVIIIGSVAFPFALMSPLLTEPNALFFACINALATGAVALMVISVTEPNGAARGAASGFALGFSIITAVAFLFAWSVGATPLDIGASLLRYSASQLEFYHLFREYSAFQLLSAGAALGCAVFCHYRKDYRWVPMAAKGYFVLLALYALWINNPANSHALLGYAGPWCWLVIFGGGRASPTLARCLLATTAAWSPMLAYPIPGSQQYFGSLPILLTAIVCASDLVNVATKSDALKKTAILFSLVRSVSTTAALAMVLVLIVQLRQESAQYARFRPLALPGTQFMHIEPRRGRIYRQLVEELNGADMALTTFRFNSFYRWSTAKMPGTVYNAHSIAYAQPEEQALIKADMLRAEHPIIVTRDAPQWAQQYKEALILNWIEADFTPYRRIGKYTLLKPKGAEPQ